MSQLTIHLASWRLRQESGLETRIAVDTQGIDDATRTLDDSLHSTHKLATVAKIADSSDRKGTRVGWNKEVPEGVKPPVILESRRNGKRSIVMMWCMALTFSLCLLSDPIL